ncbi:MAG TPA: glycoside hydrolase family 20 zincin-like fold domain-containing protein [Phycisphaerae bacterium]|nr:glycoside hydrolase family 20 zincin-like fold domain-containing protein [Phycisphaerae bacterium]
MLESDLLVPVKKFTRRQGAFRWPSKPALAGGRGADMLPLKQLAADLAGRGLWARVEQSVFGPAAVRIRRDKAVCGAEAYRMTVAPGGVEIAASGDAGAYYAVQTLRELLGASGRALSACEIEDAPDFARRGVYHDCSRGKVPKLAALKGLVEQLARWKINELQLYVENVFAFRRHPAVGCGYSPLTPQEILKLQDHCKLHHVRLVGSLSSFGHMEKILMLPEYVHLGELPGKWGLPGGSTLCPTDAGSIKLVSELYEEFMPLFEADDFNICCDETWELGKGRSKSQADKVGVGRVYMDFLLKLHHLCRKHGKRTNMWADIVLEHPELLSEWPKDVVMLNWDYDPNGGRIPRTKEITDRHLPCVVCPGTNSWGSHGCRLEMGMRNIAAFTDEGFNRGAEGVLNTDWGDGGHRNMMAVSLHNFAYGAAHSWNHGDTQEAGFTERFCVQTFGDGSGKLAKAIRTLGRTDEALGLPYGNGGIPYYLLLHPAGKALPEWGAKSLDRITADSLAAHIGALSALRWPAPREAKSKFLADTFAEYALATRLDTVACQWLAILKQVKDGGMPARALLRGYATQAQALAAELRKVWPLRNKPSRLRDVLGGLGRIVRQCRCS